MDFIYQYIVPVISIASAIVTLVAFFKEKIKHNVLLLVITLMFSTAIVVVWQLKQKSIYDFDLLKEKQRYEGLLLSRETENIAKDARSVADSIIITGWEDYGNYLGHLSTIVGFYKRHNDRYGEEYTNLNKQLQEWQEDLRAMRTSGKVIYSIDYQGLKGLVKSSKKYLEKVGANSS